MPWQPKAAFPLQKGPLTECQGKVRVLNFWWQYLSNNTSSESVQNLVCAYTILVQHAGTRPGTNMEGTVPSPAYGRHGAVEHCCSKQDNFQGTHRDCRRGTTSSQFTRTHTHHAAAMTTNKQASKQQHLCQPQPSPSPQKQNTNAQ